MPLGANIHIDRDDRVYLVAARLRFVPSIADCVHGEWLGLTQLLQLRRLTSRGASATAVFGNKSSLHLCHLQ